MPNKPTSEELEQRIGILETSYFEIKRAQEALRDSESLFRNLFEYHATVQLVIDPDSGNIIDANNSAATFYGWTRKQLQQMRIQDINTLSLEEIGILSGIKERVDSMWKVY
jgi:PAS domain-containing protein